MQRIVTSHVGVTDHRLSDIRVEIANQKQSIENIGQVFSDWAAGTTKQINDRIERAERDAAELRKGLDRQDDEITKNILPRLALLEARLSAGAGAPFPPQAVTPDAIECIRVLSQVQDLVTDKAFKLKDNNDTLTKKLQASAPFKECLEKLKDEKNLKADFQHAFEPFKCGDPDELSERLAQIQRLNTALVYFFEKKSTVSKSRT